MSKELPKVSVITATYNAKHLLKCAIESVIKSSFQDWELIVVGDCCTDGTERVVESFGDSRVSFINLEKNSGGQASPNNMGISLAQGEYIAFLNQDDLYLPDYLQSCVEKIDDSGADIFCNPYLNCRPCENLDASTDDFDVTLVGRPDQTGKLALQFYPASTWFVRRDLFRKVGVWRSEKVLFITPSQDWLFRAFKMGSKISSLQEIGVVVFFSGARKNVYQWKTAPEQEAFLNRLYSENEFLNKMKEKAGLTVYDELMKRRHFMHLRNLRNILASPFVELLFLFSIHPLSVFNMFRFGKRGGVIRHVYSKSGAKLD